jgi:hypothetical protein
MAVGRGRETDMKNERVREREGLIEKTEGKKGRFESAYTKIFHHITVTCVSSSLLCIFPLPSAICRNRNVKCRGRVVGRRVGWQ